MTHRYEDTIEARLSRVELMLRVLIDEFREARDREKQFEQESKMSQADVEQAIQEMKDEVTRTQGTSESAVVLLKGIVEQLDQAADDPAQIRALRDQLKASTDALASAVESGGRAPTA